MPNQPPDVVIPLRAGPVARGGHLMAVRSVLRLQQSIGNRAVVRLLLQDAPMLFSPNPVCAINAPEASVPAATVETPVLPWRRRVALAWGRFSAGSHAAATIESGNDARR